MKTDRHITCSDNDTPLFHFPSRPTVILASRSTPISLIVCRWAMCRTARVSHSAQRTILIPPRHRNDLFAARPSKHSDAICMLRLCETKCHRNFSSSLRLYKTRNLSGTVDGGKASTRSRMVEVNASIVRAAANGKQASLPGTKGHGLDSCVECPFVSRCGVL
jgi:hypothetical protein